MRRPDNAKQSVHLLSNSYIFDMAMDIKVFNPFKVEFFSFSLQILHHQSSIFEGKSEHKEMRIYGPVYSGKLDKIPTLFVPNIYGFFDHNYFFVQTRWGWEQPNKGFLKHITINHLAFLLVKHFFHRNG